MFYEYPFEHVGYIDDMPKILYQVKVIHPSLRRRVEPSSNANALGTITDQGIYNIIKEQGGWGQLEDKSWIMLVYTEKIK